MAMVEISDELLARWEASASADYRSPEMQLAYLLDRHEANTSEDLERSRRLNRDRQTRYRERQRNARNVTNVSNVTGVTPPFPLDGSSSVFPNPSNSNSLNPLSLESSTAHAHEPEPAHVHAPEESAPEPDAKPSKKKRQTPIYPDWYKAFHDRAPWQDKLAAYTAAMKWDPDDALVAEFNAGLDRWLGCQRWADGKICDGQTWFNQRRWEHEPTPKGGVTALSVPPLPNLDAEAAIVARMVGGNGQWPARQLVEFWLTKANQAGAGLDPPQYLALLDEQGRDKTLVAIDAAVKAALQEKRQHHA